MTEHTPTQACDFCGYDGGCDCEDQAFGST